MFIIVYYCLFDNTNLNGGSSVIMGGSRKLPKGCLSLGYVSVPAHRKVST